MCQGDTTRGGSSSVHPHQTKLEDLAVADCLPSRTGRAGDFMPMEEETFGGPAPTPRACEESFRHSGWRPGRIRVLEALRASNASAARIRRFRECGSNCYVEYSRSLNRYRFRACLMISRASASTSSAAIPPGAVSTTVRPSPMLCG